MSRLLRLLRHSQCLTSEWLAAPANRPRFALARATAAAFSTASPVLAAKALPPRPKPPPESEIEEAFLKGSGPGGQKINKTNSAVQLKHLPTGIVVKSQATRSRDQNRKIAREILAQRIDEHFKGDDSRTAKVARIKRKKTASADKKKRRKYRKLGEDDNKAESIEDVKDASKHERVRDTKEDHQFGPIDDIKKS